MSQILTNGEIATDAHGENLENMKGLDVNEENALKKPVRHLSMEADSSSSYEEVMETVGWLLKKTQHRPCIGIVCGTGLGGLVDMLENSQAFPYQEIPGFAASTAPGHAGRLVFGNLRGKPCVCMQGRIHMYEGYPMHKIAFPVRIMKLMGVHTLILTNAAGGLNASYNVGDIVMMKDHINLPGLCGLNPLIGANDERLGPRFPGMISTYDKPLRELAKACAQDLNFDFVREGIFVVQSGPAFETVTECKLLRLLGADTVGMSVVPEATTARHCGMRIFAMSLVTNMSILEYDSPITPNIEEVMETGKMRSKDMQALISLMVERMDHP